MKKLAEILAGNSYPGRGIILGRSECGAYAAAAYFIMGRSQNSRNRVFVSEGDGLRTKAHDPALLKDPSLVIYNVLRVKDGMTILTNGDQTDTIYDALSSGGSFETALRTRDFEPDGPNYTPRISGIVEKSGAYKLSILKSSDGNPAQTQRFFYEYSAPISGQGHFIHTYECDGDPIPSFYGEPVCIEIKEDAESFANGIWRSLNADNKVSLFVRYINIADGKYRTVIKNKNLGD